MRRILSLICLMSMSVSAQAHDLGFFHDHYEGAMVAAAMVAAIVIYKMKSSKR